MPARKPKDLIERHETIAERTARLEAEEALKVARELPKEPPSRIAKRKVAAAAWRRVMRMYSEMEARIVTRLDLDHLIDYCILVEECAQLDKMRGRTVGMYELLERQYAAALEADDFDEASGLVTKVLGAQEAITKLDARKDRKLDLIKKWRESLYITPRSRAGTAPARKEADVPPDDMELLLNDVEGFVNG